MLGIKEVNINLVSVLDDNLISLWRDSIELEFVVK